MINALSMGPYKNLQVWQKAMTLAKEVYTATASYPKSEVYGLVSQMRRCVVSIASNIAEGYGRGTNNDLVHFLYISLGSSNELETQLFLSQSFSYIEEGEAQNLLQQNEQVNKMLSSLIYTRMQPAFQSGSITLKPETPRPEPLKKAEPQNPKTTKP